MAMISDAMADLMRENAALREIYIAEACRDSIYRNRMEPLDLRRAIDRELDYRIKRAMRDGRT